MANVVLNPPSTGGGPNIATNAITRDTVTEHMELVNVADPNTGTSAAVDSSGLHVSLGGALPAGTNTIGGVNVIQPLPAGSNNIGTVNLNSGPGFNSSGNGQFVAVGDQQAKIDVGANATVDIIAAVPGKQIYVTSYTWMASLPATGSGGMQWLDGTTSTPLSGIMAVTPETGDSLGNGFGCILGPLNAGDKLTIQCSGGASIQGHLTYTVK